MKKYPPDKKTQEEYIPGCKTRADAILDIEYCIQCGRIREDDCSDWSGGLCVDCAQGGYQ